jgi:hypothetical protein
MDIIDECREWITELIEMNASTIKFATRNHLAILDWASKCVGSDVSIEIHQKDVRGKLSTTYTATIRHENMVLNEKVEKNKIIQI